MSEIRVINLDTNTAIAFIAENSPLRFELKQYVAGCELVMTQAAMEEFKAIVKYSAGVKEKARSLRFLHRVRMIPNAMSEAAQSLRPTRQLGEEDIMILGTGDRLGIVTMTADAKAIRAAIA